MNVRRQPSAPRPLDPSFWRKPEAEPEGSIADIADIALTLRGPLFYRLADAAARNGEEPVTLLARSVERMILNGTLDTAENNKAPSLLTIKDFWIANAAHSCRL